MLSDTLIYALAAIGALVVIAVTLAALYVAILLAPVLAERALGWCAMQVFKLGGGRPKSHEEGFRRARPPYDRIVLELHWLRGVCKLVQKKLGVVNYVGNPAERPDMDAFYERREETRGDTA